MVLKALFVELDELLWNISTMSRFYMEQIHERLKTELAARKITAAAAARAAGLPDSQGLRDTLNGRKRVTADLLALLIPLGVDALYVLTGQRSPSMPATDPAEQVLLDSYRRCGAQAKQNLIQTAALLSAGLGSSAMATPAPSSKPRTRSAAGGRGSIRIDGTVHGHVVQGDVVQHGPVSAAPSHIHRSDV